MSSTFVSENTVDTQDFSGLPMVELTVLWRRHLTERVPNHLPKSLLAAMLAFRLQIERHGGLSKKAMDYFKAIEMNIREGREPEAPYVLSNQLKLGTQLGREHGGVLHRVMVLEGGYAWAGKTFNSLSAVAKAITGTNWNGHRFFGLQDKGSGKDKVVAEVRF